MLYYRFRTTVHRCNPKMTMIGFFIAFIFLLYIMLEIFELIFHTHLYAVEISAGKIELYSPLCELKDFDSTDFSQPTEGVLTSPYGTRWGKMHEGIDIGGEYGTEIFSVESGTVLLSQWVQGYGNYIEIDHGNGYVTAYAHCDELCIHEGDIVAKNQKIATMGSTGNSTGPHLHFEVLRYGEPQNPLEYVIY